RLLVYMTMGILFYFVFSELLNDVESISEIKGFKYLPGILGAVVIVYGLWTLLKLPGLKICPAKYAKGAVTLTMGILIGSFICPPFIFMLISNIEESIFVLILSVIMFWVGSSVSIIVLGAVSGRFSSLLKEKKGREWVRNVCAFTLIFTGIWFIATVFIGA
ncbi:MAG: sulfite exporter TauE/SafE family protein, partial [Candidatus Thermoplasmatota archaeon]|nr:sulfite exporter TauE/SafE family protein [Candidatus Thermoplasmatota archaeon]